MDALVKWWDDFKARAPLPDEEMEDYCCIVVGNKLDVVENTSERVSEADALRFLDVLVPSPSSPVLAVEEGEEPESPTRPFAITIAPRPPLTPLSQPPFRHSVSSSTRFHSQSGTLRSLRSIYHTPSSSIFDQYHSAQASPEASSSGDATTRFTSETYLTPGSPESRERRRRAGSVSSESSGSALTMTPSLFARSRAAEGDTPTSPLGRAAPRPDRRPRLFFTSAKTGEGLAEVFEYIAWRVVTRWEYEAGMDARTMHVRETSAADTIRLGLAALGSAQRPQRGCC